MSHNRLTAALAAVLICISALTTMFAWQNVRMTGRWIQLQETRKMHSRQQVLANNILRDVVAYGRKNPEILPILETVGFRFVSNAEAGKTNSAPAELKP